MEPTATEGAFKGEETPTSAKKKKTPAKKEKTGENKSKEHVNPEACKKKGEGGGSGPNKAPPTSTGVSDTGAGPAPSKAELRRMRREKQENDRKKKEELKEAASSAQGVKKPQPPRVADNIKADVAETQKKVAKNLNKQKIPRPANDPRIVALFEHLLQYEWKQSLTQRMQFSSDIHPAVVKLGVQYAEGIVIGSNARCVALLSVLKTVISDYVTPPTDDLCRDLISKIKPNISFLNQCRPLSVSMGTAIKYLKHHISKSPTNITETEAKCILYDCIDQFLVERISLAAEAISGDAAHKISDGDVILIYSCSSLIRRVLVDAHKKYWKKFRVIVVDSRPKMEGKEALRRLVKEGIQCTYVLIGAVSYVISEATKVFLGAHGLLANGFVMSRVGTALISLLAKSSNVPVLVCCETYKFSERVQTDSFVLNELGDPDDLVNIGDKTPYLQDWRQDSSLTLLNLMYDFTPPEFVSMVITEIGKIPCTSVPVVLRMKQTNET